jgi:hypothetical protein
MGLPILIIGKSGAGKSTSLRNCVNNPNWNLIRVLNKPLPFKGKINGWHTDDYDLVKKCLRDSKAANIVIDDAGYLITNMFMKGHSSAGQGNAVFSFYNKIGDNFWNLINFITTELPEEKIVYVLMHEEQNDFGQIKAKTIGKILDDKVCVEGMFTIVLRCIEESNKHLFVTQCADGAVSKSPIGMFEDLTIDNDLAQVEKSVRAYYELPEKLTEKKGDK